MDKNSLRLSDSKTEVIIFGTLENVNNVIEWIVDVGDATIWSSLSMRNTGATLDPTLEMETHIANMKRACNTPLCDLHKIRQYFTSEAAEKLVHAFCNIQT